jgi:hypothetical protein
MHGTINHLTTHYTTPPTTPPPHTDGFSGFQLDQASREVLIGAGLVLHIERLDIQHSATQVRMRMCVCVCVNAL